MVEIGTPQSKRYCEEVDLTPSREAWKQRATRIKQINLTEGYAERTSDGYWRFTCPKCRFGFAKKEHEVSGPIDCPNCGDSLLVSGRSLSSGQVKDRKDAGSWVKRWYANMTKAAESIDVRPVTWLPYVDMEYLADACDRKIVKKGDVISIPHMGQKFQIEIVSFMPAGQSEIQVSRSTKFRVLKKDSNEVDHFYDPDPEVDKTEPKGYAAFKIPWQERHPLLRHIIWSAIGLAILASGIASYFIANYFWILTCAPYNSPVNFLGACPTPSFNVIPYIGVVSLGIVWCVAVYIYDPTLKGWTTTAHSEEK